MLRISPLARLEDAPRALLREADPADSRVEAYLAEGQCFVAERDGAVVGVYVLLPTGPDRQELMNIAVRPDLQGQGLGKQLLHHAIETAREAGARVLEVGTGNSSLAQLGFYQKAGFRMVGIEPDFFTRHYPMPIWENGIHCRDMVRLSRPL